MKGEDRKSIFGLRTPSQEKQETMSWKTRTIIPILSKISSVTLKQKKAGTHLTILAYHRIMDFPPDYLLDEGVISTSPDIFEQEMEFCAEHFHLINFKILKDCLEGRQALPEHPLIITFDDGYRDNYTHAFPILKKYGLPATVFLTVDHINSSEPFWWDIASFSLKHNGSKGPLEIRQFLRCLKTIPNDERLKKIQELKIRFETALKRLERQTLTWEEIKEMSHNGIEFGSHTMTHPVLSQIQSEPELRYELSESKRIIEERLACEVIALSYPVGGQDAFNESVQQKIREAGYDLAISYLHGINKIDGDLNRFNLKRLDADKISLEKFKSKLAFPYLFQCGKV